MTLAENLSGIIGNVGINFMQLPSVNIEQQILDALYNNLRKLISTIENITIPETISTQEAKKEIVFLDNLHDFLYKYTSTISKNISSENKAVLNIIFNELTQTAENLRETLELMTDSEYRQTIQDIKNNDYSDFVKLV